MRIVLPDNHDEQQSVMEIAQKNGIDVISSSEFKRMSIRSIPDITLQANNIDHLFETIETSCKLGNIQMLQSVLEKSLKDSTFDIQSLARLRCILGVVYALNGRISDAEKITTQHIIDNLASSADTMERKLSYLTQFHLAKSNIYPLMAIEKLEKLQCELENSQCFNLFEIKGYQALLTLECAIQYNREAGQYSTELTFKDFDNDGKKCNLKYQYANQARLLLQQIDLNVLPIQERIIALMELGYAVRRSKDSQYFDLAMDALQKAQKLLQYELNPKANDYSQALRDEFELQLKSIKLNIGLCGVQFQRNLNQDGLTMTPIEYLLNFKKEELDKLTAMQAKILIKRWIGLDPGDLYLDGWWYHSPRDEKQQGTELIAIYRKYMPLDIKKYIRELEDNVITELDLNYLGVMPPVGISHEDFTALCDALSKNTSLKALSLRKCTLKETINPECKDRVLMVFEALRHAQQKGQALHSLFYASNRFSKPEEYQACLDYFKENKSIKILQASLFDWNDPKLIQEFASIIQHHPALKTLLTDIIQCPGAGDILYEACMKSLTIEHVYPYARSLNPQLDKGPKYDNQESLKFLSQTLEKSKKNDQYDLHQFLF